eukprot:303498-Prymnesium_polylepis.1
MAAAALGWVRLVVLGVPRVAVGMALADPAGRKATAATAAAEVSWVDQPVWQVAHLEAVARAMEAPVAAVA